MNIMESVEALKAKRQACVTAIGQLNTAVEGFDADIANLEQAVAPFSAAFAPAAPPVKTPGTRCPRSAESIAKAAATRAANKAATGGTEQATATGEKKPRDYAKEVEQRRVRNEKKKAEQAAAGTGDPLAS